MESFILWPTIFPTDIQSQPWLDKPFIKPSYAEEYSWTGSSLNDWKQAFWIKQSKLCILVLHARQQTCPQNLTDKHKLSIVRLNQTLQQTVSYKTQYQLNPWRKQAVQTMKVFLINVKNTPCQHFLIKRNRMDPKYRKREFRLDIDKKSVIHKLHIDFNNIINPKMSRVVV